MIKIIKGYYNPNNDKDNNTGECVCSACGREIYYYKSEKVVGIQMNKSEILLCDKCSKSLSRKLNNVLKHN